MPKELTKAEIDYLKAGLARSYKERFMFATALYKAQINKRRDVMTFSPYVKRYELKHPVIGISLMYD